MSFAAAQVLGLSVVTAVMTFLGSTIPISSHGAGANLFVELEGEIQCPSSQAIKQAFTRHIVSAHVIFGNGSEQRAQVTLSASQPNQLDVRLSLGASGVHFSRVLGARREECMQLGETAAHLVAAWLEQVSWNADATTLAPPLPVPSAPLTELSVRLSVIPATPLVAVDVPTIVTPAEPVVSSAAETPLSPSSVLPQDRKLAVVPGLCGGPYYEPQARRFGWHASVAGQAALGPSWSLGLDLGADAPLRISAAPGHVTVNAQTLTGVVAHNMYHGASGNLDLLISLGAERINAAGTGYTRDASVTRYGFSGAALLRLGRRLVWGVTGSVFAGVQVRAPARDIGIVGLGTFFPLSPLRPEAGLALSWDL